MLDIIITVHLLTRGRKKNKCVNFNKL